MNHHQELDFCTMCSGIEAPSVALEPIGFRARWFAEIEPFPSAVLAHHYPSVPNHGDMTKLIRRILTGAIEAPPLAIAGTPCQAFSVAGWREGLTDPRGALTIKFVETIDAIDLVRTRRSEPECIAWWENVPGVLSDKENAFGCFLGALVGESEELQPPGGKWKDAGCVYGPKRTAAWRVLDAQYFGLAQRRRRVFVIASARAGFDPLEVLFEREGMRRDHPPRRGEGQDLAGHAPFGPALQCGCGYLFDLSLGQWGCPNCEGDEGPAVEVMAGVPAFGGENQSRSLFQASAQHGVCVTGDITHTLKAEGFDASEDGTGRGQPIVADVAPTLRSGNFRNHSNPATEADSLVVASAVRRLTPRECERLQGFPDDYTLIPWAAYQKAMRAAEASLPRTATQDEVLRARIAALYACDVSKEAADECPDGPRYKAIGNSKAVPVVRWIGRRLKAHLEKLS
ncbi:DNA cytosine methyltransferase [Pseudomonas aeruginosa]|uniref:DNA cytosine methyltransferase n=1 Tax=Pseudomonas aeruginosa TaxID=287 RepID=UPI000E31722B|nr:DNA cytosine methyltransferase [Pseudomonas aeruginosa]MBV5548501.1 DNA cytosine methyltransferase [Pseudomonas aeruginosa]MBV5556784.1 DNA cytosine methyltransferase [Pseudomonas aeruginosa]MBV6005256.1 DNA cytosine methyltransferase [Pseudomonas aeruginosa]MBV6018502.1 DNA cytosine methyltransferase [Pseudomonas aeruginosa]MBV6030924.1 DNA cytosine methyltransferase [Pseudomonas aeruginosa]